MSDNTTWKQCPTCHADVATGTLASGSVWQIKHDDTVVEPSPLSGGMTRVAFMNATVAHDKEDGIVTHTITVPERFNL